MSAEHKARRKPDAYYRRIYALFRPIFRLVAWGAYGVRVRRPVRYSEPVLILANHTSDLDFTDVAAHIANHMYFVASDHVTAMGLFAASLSAGSTPSRSPRAQARPAASSTSCAACAAATACSSSARAV